MSSLTDVYKRQDLALGDITCKVRDRVGLVILRHGQDRDHGDGTGLTLLASCSLIKGSQVGIHISGITAASGNFLTGCGDLTE